MKMATKTHHGKTGLYYLKNREALLSSITGSIHLTKYTHALICTETARKYAIKNNLAK